MIMAKVLHSMLFSSIILLGTAPAPSSSQSPPAPLSTAGPLGPTAQIPPAPLSAVEPPGPTKQTPPAPSPGVSFGGYAERVRGPEFDEQETYGFLRGLDGRQKSGAVLMVLGGSGLLVCGGWMVWEKVRPVSSRRRRFGPLGQPRKMWMG